MAYRGCELVTTVLMWLLWCSTACTASFLFQQCQVWDAAGQCWGIQERDCHSKRERTEDGCCHTEAWADCPHIEWGSESCQRETCHGWGLSLFHHHFAFFFLLFCFLVCCHHQRGIAAVHLWLNILSLRAMLRPCARRETCWSWWSPSWIKRKRHSRANSRTKTCCCPICRLFR